MIVINTDAAYNPQTREAGIGIILKIHKEQKHFKYFLSDIEDNHVAEFIALWLALEIIQKKNFGNEVIHYRSDSKIVVQSLEKSYVKNPKYIQIFNQVVDRAEKLSLFFPKWVPEKENLGADRLARQALLKQGKLDGQFEMGKESSIEF